ncbi:ead/Ea22-like family protein [Salmonella enterica]|nr:ead/Ea22-like family protein [Salmonella enterica]EDQ0830426.1 ead/Ea22-like family protein [Salmonella enterica subsp. arizonae]EDW8110646.1 ead/Ea22-like family protein [Salmonella enterica subsp. enterica serovar 4,[5],12:i:-]EAR9851335.1 ead/Ea22-like family protein [Salmonella enterica]EGF3207569.1 ead/Ea22-like family protein [Salmonella enterica]
MTIDKQALLGPDKHSNQHKLSRLIAEANSAEIRDIAEAVEQYTDQLIAALEAAEKRIAEQREYYEGVISDGSKRIAELEASHSKLRDTIATIHNTIRMDGGYTPLAAILNAAKRAYEESASAAGIGVKQQEDSVDSDVGSRNQPGMVVAVHIGAGDFVKVKGQVFEVEETDFDDHDVTLWFVGGNALKCAAGCPVEVVSAPVAAGIKVKGE